MTTWDAMEDDKACGSEIWLYRLLESITTVRTSEINFMISHPQCLER